MNLPRMIVLGAVALLFAALTFEPAAAQMLQFDLGDEGDGSSASRLIQLIALVTILSLAPSILVMFTSFTRIVVVLTFWFALALGRRLFLFHSAALRFDY